MGKSNLEINLFQYLLDLAKTPKQRETAELRACGLVDWLRVNYFPTRIRKYSASSGVNAIVTSPNRGLIRITAEQGTGHESGDVGDTISADTRHQLDKSEWEKAVHTALKKIIVEDLGNLNAADLKSSLPQTDDKEGRGLSDLHALEKKLSVKVVFDDHTGHVLLVGDGKKLEKKCFVIRNMISHYHWRLSGSDVAFDKATSR